MFKYKGAIHIHTVKSDGTGNIEEITNAAKKAGLSWLIITDHNYIDKEEGIINGIYVIKGQEISPKRENHYLVIGTDRLFSPDDDLQFNIDEVRKSNGFGFAAHPDESDYRKNKNKPIKWLDKNIIPDGIEIWNLFSQWGDNYNSSNVFTAAYSYIFRNKLITKPQTKTLNWWDELNNKSAKIIPAIGGVDAHALIRKDYMIPLKIFPYKYCFETITNEILLKEELSKDFQTAKIQIINAIKQGNNIIFNNKIHNNPPEIYIANHDHNVHSGETIAHNDKTFLNIKSDKKLKILVFKNGLNYHIFEGKNLELHLTEKGKYRVEALINNKGYVYTNPISVV